MRKRAFFSTLVVLWAMIFFTGIATAAAPVQQQQLGQGMVQVYDLGSIKLHAYQTADPMHDECFVLETADNLVAIESPAFEVNIAQWKAYIDGLGKPLTDMLLSYHPSAGWYGTARTHATAKAKQAMTEGATRKLVEFLSTRFGPEFNTQAPHIDSVIPTGPNTIGGIDFDITDDGDGYDIAIPSAGVIYIHMLGADSHSILAGQDQINAYLATLENIKAKGYSLILSSHHTPETLADVETKIAYVQRVRELAAQSESKEDFIARVKKEFPNYVGDNYLDMTAGFLFAK
ncbi:MAG: hypothetical protein ACK5PS_06845 [Desulfopila sp.]